MEPYGIDHHRHLFAQWAAGTAARRGWHTNGNGLTGEGAKFIIETAGLHNLIASPESLPTPDLLDATHREWRRNVMDAALHRQLVFTHGVASKLINIYLKSAFVCGGFHNDGRVKALHPPVDDQLLNKLRKENCGGERRFWKASKGWTTYTSEQYEGVISKIRFVLEGKPMWMIEEYWCGHQ